MSKIDTISAFERCGGGNPEKGSEEVNRARDKKIVRNIKRFVTLREWRTLKHFKQESVMRQFIS